MNRTAQYLEDKVILVTGATGFLGQPLVEKILWESPSVRRIYVLIRPRRLSSGQIVTAQHRLENDLYESTVFERMRGRHGDGFRAFLEEKLVAVAGDLSQDDLGLDPNLRSNLQDNLDIVINSAAVVSFDASLDQALHLNVLGAKRVTEFAASCKHTILVHVSTAYVGGAGLRLVPETLHHTAKPTGNGATLFPPGQFRDVELDLRRIQSSIDRCHREAHDTETERQLLQALVRRSRSARHGRISGRRKTLESLRKRWLEKQLTDEGMRLARERGWNDTYTYTKALGEQMVLRYHGDTPTVIMRPSVIESSLSEPSPGWLDGLRMADPLIAAIGKGRLRALPLRPDVQLDLVPVDMVVNAILASMPRIAEKRGLECYHLATGSRNPITVGTFYDLIYRYFIKNPMLRRSGQPIRIRYLRFPNPSLFRLQHRLTSTPLRTVERFLDKLPVTETGQKLKRKVAANKAANDRLYYYGEIYEPYLNSDRTFQVHNTMRLLDSLDDDEKKVFDFDVTHLNWRHYVQNVHIPGVKKFILKLESSPSRLESEGEPGAPTTIYEIVEQSALRFGYKIALQIRRNGRWERFSFAEVKRAADDVAHRLRSLGLRKGDRVVLYSENQPEWGITYMGAVSIGLVVVPIDAQTWHREVRGLIAFTDARALLASEHCFTRLRPKDFSDPTSKRPLFLNVNDACAPFDGGDSSSSVLETHGNGDHKDEVVLPDDPASIIFTTGTASDPKGAVHTHRSFLSNVNGVTCYSPLDETDRLLSVLPLYHALEFTCGFLASLYRGATVTYTSALKPKMILETMRETGTTCMLGVPTLYALIRDDVERRVLKSGRSSFRGKMLATRKQLVRVVDLQFGRNYGRRLFARAQKEFGGRIRCLVSGGSALGGELYDDYQALGMPIYEGYGLTETAPVVTFSPYGASRRGSVGKPLPGVEIRIDRPGRDGTGEILVRTPSLMQGYYRNPEATRRAIRDGWLYTGDVGCVDEDGYLYITGRIKDVIVTGAGKNVYPEDLEATYAGISEIDEICVVGLKSGLTEDVHALVVPTRAALEPGGLPVAKKTILDAVHALARDLPSYHRLQYVHMRLDPLPRNQTGSIARDVVRRELHAVTGPATAAPKPRRRAAVVQREQVLDELARLSRLPVPEIREERDLYKDLGLDSLEAIELLLFVENQFGVLIADEQADRIRTVGELLTAIDGKREDGPEGAKRKPLLRSLLPYAERTWVHRTVGRVWLAAANAWYRLYFRLRHERSNGLPKNGAYIIAANHSSHLDLGAVRAALSAVLGPHEAEKLHVLGAQDYFFDKPIKSWFFSTFLNLVPIRRERTGLAGLRMAQGILERGEPVLIFPEATRTRTGRLQEFKPGLGLLALESHAPIVPCHIEGSYRALPAGKLVPRRIDLQVRFGSPISMDRYQGNGGSRDELYREISLDVRRDIERLARGEKITPHADEPGSGSALEPTKSTWGDRLPRDPAQTG